MLETHFEKLLNDFDPIQRQQAAKALAVQAKNGEFVCRAENPSFNLHCHTFFSYNAYGFSPAGLAWLAKKKGYRALGIVDFDTLDGVNEFLDNCELLEVRGSAGIETRVYIPEFAQHEINSPGEQGVCYHMGLGFASSDAPEIAVNILRDLRQRSDQRNRAMIERINQYLELVNVDYDKDVLPLTPAGNATERHMLTAYIRCAEEQVSDVDGFWSKALGLTREQVREIIIDTVKFPNMIRVKLMKRGGVGYVQPGPTTFPSVDEFHQLITACGAIPCFAWLDGTSSGEQAIKELLELMVSKGVGVVNIIPDRNWNISNPEQRKQKVQHLYDFVKLAQDMDLPVNVGTEMNSPGNKYVDDFDAPELAPLYPIFYDGASFIYGHTLMQRALGCGYQSVWAQKHLPTRPERNTFFTQLGKLLPPGSAWVDLLKTFNSSYSPQEILQGLSSKVRSND